MEIVNKINQLRAYCEKYIFVNFDKNSFTLKHNIEKNLYGALENVLYANVNVGNIRGKYLKDLLVNIMILDAYFREAYDKKIFKKRRFNCLNGFLSEIRKMCYGLIAYVKNK
ncbi:MAG: hypothetical protein RR984_04225 [Bacilli bacterium]